jgi:hypothetical protein
VNLNLISTLQKRMKALWHDKKPKVLSVSFEILVSLLDYDPFLTETKKPASKTFEEWVTMSFPCLDRA